jgi:HlyD family secretion protein
MFKKVFGGLLILVLLATFVGTLYFLYSKSREKPAVHATQQPFVTSVVKKTVATGSVVPRLEVEVKPQVSGIVEEIYVEAGDVVAKNELIAKVRIVPDMVNLSNAENRLKRAEISLENARNEHQRNDKMFRQGLISESEFVVFDLALKNARQELAAAEDNLALIREGARKKAAGGATTNTLVRATAAGMILDVPVEEGDSVIEANTFNDGTTIVSIADMEEMVFEGTVDESEVGRIREGMPLIVTVGAIDTERFDATLEYIAPKGVEDEGAIVFEIRAAMQLKQEVFLRANYSANADIVLDRHDEVLAIRESWLQFDGETPYVEVETTPQIFERRDIETGLSDGIIIEVSAGLSEGDRIKDPSGSKT